MSVNYVYYYKIFPRMFDFGKPIGCTGTIDIGRVEQHQLNILLPV